MEPTPSLSDLLRASSGPVAVGVDGQIMDLAGEPGPAGPTLLVAPVTDALKSVSDEGIVSGVLDRERTWKVVAYHLDAATRERLAERADIGVEEIYRVVIDMGLGWDAQPV